MRKNVFLPNGNNKSTFQPEGAAPAASSLKSSYIKNEEKLSKERGTLNIKHHVEHLFGYECCISVVSNLYFGDDSFHAYLNSAIVIMLVIT